MMLARIRIMRQLRALSGFQNCEDNHAYKRPYELRDRGIDIQDSEVEAREFACGRAVIFLF